MKFKNTLETSENVLFLFLIAFSYLVLLDTLALPDSFFLFLVRPNYPLVSSVVSSLVSSVVSSLVSSVVSSLVSSVVSSLVSSVVSSLVSSVVSSLVSSVVSSLVSSVGLPLFFEISQLIFL